MRIKGHFFVVGNAEGSEGRPEGRKNRKGDTGNAVPAQCQRSAQGSLDSGLDRLLHRSNPNGGGAISDWLLIEILQGDPGEVDQHLPGSKGSFEDVVCWIEASRIPEDRF